MTIQQHNPVHPGGSIKRVYLDRSAFNKAGFVVIFNHNSKSERAKVSGTMKDQAKNIRRGGCRTFYNESFHPING